MPNYYFGSFADKNSFIHHLDARVKIFYVFVLSTFLYSAKKSPEILIFTLTVLLIISVSRMDVRYIIKNLRAFLSVFLFILLMYSIFSGNKIIEGVFVLWQFLMLILISLVLTYTTSISQLTLAIEKLSQPLKIFHVKPRNIALMLTIAIRFIPVMLLRLERTTEAMLSRLSDFRKLKSTKILAVSLLERMFASASNLSDAMTARLYNENIKSTKTMRFTRNDYISLISLFIFALWFLMV